MSTVVEELILKLGLDAKGMDSVDPVDNKLGKLNGTVEKLDANLKSVESTLRNIAQLSGGTIKLGDTKVTAPKEKKEPKESTPKLDKRDKEKADRMPTTLKRLLMGIVPYAKDGKPKLRIIGQLGGKTIKLGETKVTAPKEKKEPKESTSKLDKRDKEKSDRMPTTLKSLLTGIGGPLATLASGVYLFKSMAQAAMGLWNVAKGFLNESKELVNVGKFSGIAASKLKGLGTMAEFLGYKSEDTISDIEQLGRTLIKMKPDDYNEGLARMGIVPYERDGVPKSIEKILGEIAHWFTRPDMSMTEKYRIGDQYLKIGPGTVEILAMGWKNAMDRIAGFQKSGLVPTESEIQEERLQVRVAAFNKARASTTGRKDITSITDLLTGTIAAALGTDGAPQALDSIMANGPEKTMKMLEGRIEKEKLNQFKRMFGLAVDESGMRLTPSYGTSSFGGFYTGMGLNNSADLTVQSATFNIQQRKDGSVESATVNGKPIKNVKMASPVPPSQ